MVEQSRVWQFGLGGTGKQGVAVLDLVERGREKQGRLRQGVVDRSRVWHCRE